MCLNHSDVHVSKSWYTKITKIKNHCVLSNSCYIHEYDMFQITLAKFRPEEASILLEMGPNRNIPQLFGILLVGQWIHLLMEFVGSVSQVVG